MSWNEVTMNLPNYPMEELAKIRQRLVQAQRKVYDFGTGDPKIPTWEPIRKALLEHVPSISQYPSTRGCPELVSAIWSYLDRHFAVRADKGFDIAASNGSKEAIFHVALCLVGRAGGKRIIAYPDPGYPVYRSSALFAGGVPYPIRLSAESGFQLEPWNLPREVQTQIAALWINYPHNPTGATMSESHLDRIIDWCRDRDVVLLADDCYIDIYDEAWDKTGQRPPSPIAKTCEKVFSFMSLSKRSGMTGYRSGFVVGDANLMPALHTARANFGVGTPTMIQRAAAIAWADEQHVAERRRIFSRRLDLAFQRLHALGLIDSKPEATFYLWCKVPKAWDDVKFCLKLAEEGVITSPSQWLSEGIKGYFRLALVPDEADTSEALSLLESLVARL